MIPIAAAGTMGLRILKTLYKGKKMVGSGAKKASKFAADKGFSGTSKAITGTSNRVHQGTKYVSKKIKKYPNSASAVGGAIAFDIFDND